MPRPEDLYAMNPMLQALRDTGDTFQKTMHQVTDNYRWIAAKKFLSSIGEMSGAPDYQKLRTRGAEVLQSGAAQQKYAEELAKPDGGNPENAFIMDKVLEGNKKIAMANYMNKVDSAERNEALKHHMMNNLAIISDMTPSERSTLDFATQQVAPDIPLLGGGGLGIGSGSSSKSSSGGGGGKGKAQYKPKVWNPATGKFESALFYSDTGELEFTGLPAGPEEEFDPNAYIKINAGGPNTVGFEIPPGLDADPVGQQAYITQVLTYAQNAGYGKPIGDIGGMLIFRTKSSGGGGGGDGYSKLYSKNSADLADLKKKILAIDKNNKEKAGIRRGYIHEYDKAMRHRAGIGAKKEKMTGDEALEHLKRHKNWDGSAPTSW